MRISTILKIESSNKLIHTNSWLKEYFTTVVLELKKIMKETYTLKETVLNKEF